MGSYCYLNTCADIAQWPPKSDLPLLNAGGKTMSFRLDGNVSFTHWQAAYNSRSNDDESTPLGDGGHRSDPDANGSPASTLDEATITAPPVGDWVVWVWADLENGDLSYAWHVIVLPDTST